MALWDNVSPELRARAEQFLAAHGMSLGQAGMSWEEFAAQHGVDPDISDNDAMSSQQHAAVAEYKRLVDRPATILAQFLAANRQARLTFRPDDTPSNAALRDALLQNGMMEGDPGAEAYLRSIGWNGQHRAGDSSQGNPFGVNSGNSGGGNAGTTLGTGNGSGIPPSAAQQALINFIQANLGAAYGDANYNPSFDLNNDGVINGLDYSLALSGVTVPSGGPYGNGPVSGGGSGNNGTPPPPSPPAAPPPVDNPSEQGQLQAFYNEWVANGGDGTMAGFLAHYRAVNGVDLTPAQVALVFDPTGAAWPQSNGPGNGPGNGPAVVTPPPAATTTTTIRPWNVIQKPGEPFNIANFHDDEIRWYFYWGTQEEQNRAMQSTLQALGVNTANNNPWAKSLSTYVPSMAEQLTAQQLYNGGLLNPEGTAVTPLQLENSLLGALGQHKTSAFGGTGALNTFLGNVRNLLGEDETGMEAGKRLLKSQLSGDNPTSWNWLMDMLQGTLSPMILGTSASQERLYGSLLRSFNQSGGQQNFAQYLLKLFGT